MFQNANSIQAITDLMQNTDATVQYEPTSSNTEYQINVPIETITNSLTPLVQESKQFLYGKGLTEQDIQQMIVEENATETDLIPLVMSIIQLEKNQQTAHNYLTLFPISSANALSWAEVGHCAIHALGIDILFSLGSSDATIWTMGAIRTAFKTVAKRMLGPIGVAIAVVYFGFCLGGIEI